MTKKQAEQYEAVKAHLLAQGATIQRKRMREETERIKIGEHGGMPVECTICETGGRWPKVEIDVRSGTYLWKIAHAADVDPIAAYNALCAAPFFATTVGVAFGLKPMEVV